MIELMRTNDVVLISLIESLFKDADIGYFVADAFMSMMEGSTGFMARRIMVDADDVNQARRILRESGIELPQGSSRG